MSKKPHSEEHKSKIRAASLKRWATTRDNKTSTVSLAYTGTSAPLAQILEQNNGMEGLPEKSEPVVSITRRDTYYTGFANFTPAKISAFLDATKTGRMRDFVRMCDALRLRDAHLSAAIFKRKSGITSRKLVVKSKDNSSDPNLDKAREMIQKNFDILPMSIVVDHLLEGTYIGLSIAELIWDYDLITNSYYVCEVVPTATSKFSYDPNMNIFIDDPQSSNEYNGALIKDFCNRFIVHEPKMINSYSNMDGLMRIAAFYVFFKMTSIMYTSAGLAKFAFPPIIASVPEQTQAGTMASMKAELERFNSDSIAIVKNGTTFTPLVMGTNGDASYMNFINFLNGETSKLILGGTMTLDDGSSRSQSEVHERGEDALVRSDGEKLLRTLHTGFVRSWLDVNEHLFPESSIDFLVENLILEFDGLYQEETMDIEQVSKAVDLIPKTGLHLNPESLQAFFSSMGIQTSVTPPLTSEQKIAASYVDPEAGQLWIDTEDQHRLQVTSVDGKKVYYLDLDAPNPERQWSWSIQNFKERARLQVPSSELETPVAPPSI